MSRNAKITWSKRIRQDFYAVLYTHLKFVNDIVTKSHPSRIFLHQRQHSVNVHTKTKLLQENLMFIQQRERE